MEQIDLLKNTTLLFAEDDEELRASLKETLSIFFKNIVVAKDGLEALEIYNKGGIDLIITDYVMPNMDGNELCKEIRNINKKIPLVIMSSYSDQEKLLKSIDLELTNYLIKPIEYEELIATLVKIVQKLKRENLLEFVINEYKKYNFFTKEIYDKREKNYINLSKSEVIILELLINNINKIVDISKIELSLSPNEPKSEQAIKNIIHRLRTKLSKDLIQNISGMGYTLRKEIQ